MKPELETYLWDRMSGPGNKEGEWPWDIIKEMVQKGMIQSPKQGYATLNKWASKNWINYGVSIRCSWKEIEERPNTQQKVNQ